MAIGLGPRALARGVLFLLLCALAACRSEPSIPVPTHAASAQVPLAQKGGQGCLTDLDCPTSAATACTVSTCRVDAAGVGACVATARPRGTACAPPPPAGCSFQGCDGAGTCATLAKLDGAPCGSTTECKANVCQGGECTALELQVCDDGNPCTDDTCDPVEGCLHVANAAECDDGNACTAEDKCKNGACGGKNTCNCNVDADCLKEVKDKCQGAMICVKGMCQLAPGTAVDCSKVEAPVCQKAVCEPTTGACVLSGGTDGMSCEDGNPCTGGDYCSNGKCLKGLVKLCTEICGNGQDDDLNGKADCADGACDGKACDDGDPNSLNDTCVGAVCKGKTECVQESALTDCAGKLTLAVCEVPTCKAGKCAVGAAPEGTPCDDADTCTSGDYCAAGACVGATNSCK